MRILVLFALLAMSKILFSQNTLPAVVLKNTSGTNVSTDTLGAYGAPLLISFWATWCKPCIEEMQAIHEVYPEWVDKTGVKVIVVATDDSRSANRVVSMVNGFAWEFEVLLDTNGEFKRAMQVDEIPHMFLLNPHGKIVWQHTGFVSGDEEYIFNKIVECKADE